MISREERISTGRVSSQNRPTYWTNKAQEAWAHKWNLSNGNSIRIHRNHLEMTHRQRGRWYTCSFSEPVSLQVTLRWNPALLPQRCFWWVQVGRSTCCLQPESWWRSLLSHQFYTAEEARQALRCTSELKRPSKKRVKHTSQLWIILLRYNGNVVKCVFSSYRFNEHLIKVKLILVQRPRTA